MSHETYREWAGAYVLGALDPSERREFETHLGECAECGAAVASFAPLPGLLARVNAEDLEPLPERTLKAAASQARSEWRQLYRSRRRWRVVAASAAVAAVAAFVVPNLGGSSTDPLVIADGAQATGEITIQDRAWGTSIHIELDDLPDRDEFIAWAIDESGKPQWVASWSATGTGAAVLEGSSSLHAAEVTRIVITSGDPDDVLLIASA